MVPAVGGAPAERYSACVVGYGVSLRFRSSRGNTLQRPSFGRKSPLLMFDGAPGSGMGFVEPRAWYCVGSVGGFGVGSEYAVAGSCGLINHGRAPGVSRS